MGPVGIPALLHPCWGIHIAPSVTGGSIKPLITEPELPFVALRAADPSRLTGSEAALGAYAHGDGTGLPFKGTLQAGRHGCSTVKPARPIPIELLKQGEMCGPPCRGVCLWSSNVGSMHPMGARAGAGVGVGSGLSISRRGNCAPTAGNCSLYGFVVLLTRHCMRMRSLGASLV